MPITVDRHTGKIISMSEITQEQRDKLWGINLRTWLERHTNGFGKLVLEQS